MQKEEKAVKGFFTVDVYDQRNEKDRFSVFISHSGKDNDMVRSLAEHMEDAGLFPMYDLDFIKSGQEFCPIIERKMRACSAAVVLITKGSLSSGWVSYEIGYLTRLKKRIFLYDPYRLLGARISKRPFSAARLSFDARRGLLSPYFPEYCDEDSLFAVLAPYVQYQNMLEKDCEGLSRREFAARVKARVESVVLSLTSPVFEGVESELRASRLGTMIVNFGMFYDGNERGAICPCGGMAETRVICPACRENTKAPPAEVDEKTYPCALLGQSHDTKALTEENRECTLLNRVLYNGALYGAGEEMPNGETATAPTIRLYLPLHKLFGTEFKVVIDPSGYDAYIKLVEAFMKAGMNPTISDSQNGEGAPRIYLSLPERPWSGLYCLNNRYSNNFLCPGAPR